MDWLRVTPGDLPLVVSVPHTGLTIPAPPAPRPDDPVRPRPAPDLGVARPQRRGLVDRHALRLRDDARRHRDSHRYFTHGDRRQPRSLRRVALSRPGHHPPLP